MAELEDLVGKEQFPDRLIVEDYGCCLKNKNESILTEHWLGGRQEDPEYENQVSTGLSVMLQEKESLYKWYCNKCQTSLEKNYDHDYAMKHFYCQYALIHGDRPNSGHDHVCDLSVNNFPTKFSDVGGTRL